jgi:hypothetical protein
MKFEFDLPVAVTAKAAGRKTEATVVGTADLEVEVDECDPCELGDVADIWFDGTSKAPVRIFHRNDLLFIQLASVVEIPRTFSPYGPKTGFLFAEAERLIKLMVDNRVYHGGRGALYPAAAARSRRQYEPLSLRPIAALRLEDGYEEGRDIQIADFRDRCSRLLVSSGMVYVSVSEPVLGVELKDKNGQTFPLIKPFWRCPRGIPIGKSSLIPPHAVFRLDDNDGLRAFCEIAGGRSYLDTHVRVFDPARLSVDSEQLTLFGSAARIVRKAQDWIGDHPVIDEIFSIVENSANDTDFPSHLGELIRAAVDVHRSGIRVFSNELDVIAAESVAELWDARPIKVDIPSFK